MSSFLSRALAALVAIAVLAVLVLATPSLAAPAAAPFDPVARGLAVQARASASSLASLPRNVADNSMVALGDSIQFNAISDDRRGAGSNTYQGKGYFAQLLALAGGRIRPVTIAGWPYLGGAATTADGCQGTGFGPLLVANGGSGYTAATTITIPTGAGLSVAATATPIIQGGRIVGATMTSCGTGFLAQSPLITISDSGGGSGAVAFFQTVKAGSFASGGINSAQCAAYVPLILNGGSPVARNVLVQCATNDNSFGITLAQSKANIVSLCQQLVAGGVRPIVVAVLARSGTAGANARRQAEALRQWEIKELATLVPGTVVVDPSPWIMDPATDALLTNVASDGLHPTTYGAYLIAQQVWSQIRYLFPQTTAYTISDSSAGGGYDATLNPQGNQQGIQAVLADTAPTTPNATTEAPWTGARMANLFLSRVTGATGTCSCVASVVSRSDGRPGQRQRLTVSITGAAAGETYRVLWSTNGTNPTAGVQGGMSQNVLQPGDRVIATIDEASFSNVVNVYPKLKLVAGNSSSFSNTTTAASPVAGALGTAAWNDFTDGTIAPYTETLWLQTRELTIPTGTFYLTMMLEFVVNSAGAASFTVDFSGASLRRLN